MAINYDIYKLCSLGPIQTARLTTDIVWGSLFIADYRNRYDIDPNTVCDFADGYIEWLKDVFGENVQWDEDWADILNQNVTNLKDGYSFYHYTHFMYCLD